MPEANCIGQHELYSQCRVQFHNELGQGACSGEKGVGQEGRRKTLVPSFYFVSAWGPVHLTGSYFLWGLGQPVTGIPLSKNKASISMSSYSQRVLASGSCPRTWASIWAVHKTFFSGDGSHVALHSPTSSWCFSVFQPTSCSPGERSWGFWYYWNC